MKGVHLDLKGVAFKPAYIPQLLRDLSRQGVNTVLVEYEDLFPFKGINVAVDPAVTWTTGVLRRFQKEAEANSIEVIPLQQCLGHLEYVFRFKAYRRFAEDKAYPSTLCLSNAGGRKLIVDMLTQMIQAHPKSRYVHIGLDEARGLASCPKCRAKGDVLDTFLSYLNELCDVAESFGRTPIIWSDMLEDHFRMTSFGKLRERVILMPWDYATHGDRTALGRIGGFRVSKAWLGEPWNRAAPGISPGTRFIEDLPADVKRVIKPTLHEGRWFDPMPQVDLWAKLGFRTIGATAVRSSSHGPMLPKYHLLRDNIRAWGVTMARAKSMGLIGTSWARGTTFCPSNFQIDLCWPVIGELVKACGGKARPFFKGIAEKTVERIVYSLGRCREDWSIEDRLADEMESLESKLREHKYEWRCLILMARLLGIRRQAEYALSEVDYFHADVRLVDTEWRRRLREQAAAIKALGAIRKKVKAHFSKRYHGDAFEEWVRDLFDLHVKRLRDAQVICRGKLAVATKRDSGKR